MNASEARTVHASAADPMVKRMAGGLVGETIGAVAVIALAIAGLAGAWAANLAAIATIVLGAAILLSGGVFSGTEMSIQRGEWATTEFVGGLTGVILGILALLGIAAPVLLSAAVIVFGATVLFGHLLTEREFGSRGLVGIGAVVLGILAVVGLSQSTLVLVALLSLGAMELFSGLEIASVRRHHLA